MLNKKYQTLLKDTVIFAVGSIGSKRILFLLVPLYTNYPAHTAPVSPDRYIYPISAAAIVLYVAVNPQTIRHIIQTFFGRKRV